MAIFQRGHQFSEDKVGLKEFLAAKHLLDTSSESPYDQINARLTKAGIERTVNFPVPHFTAVTYVVASSDMVATEPAKLAQQACGPFGLDYMAPALRLPVLHTNILRHRGHHQDRGNHWLRGVIAENFKE